jgi:hypothetical protein
LGLTNDQSSVPGEDEYFSLRHNVQAVFCPLGGGGGGGDVSPWVKRVVFEADHSAPFEIKILGTFTVP